MDSFLTRHSAMLWREKGFIEAFFSVSVDLFYTSWFNLVFLVVQKTWNYWLVLSVKFKGAKIWILNIIFWYKLILESWNILKFLFKIITTHKKICINAGYKWPMAIFCAVYFVLTTNFPIFWRNNLFLYYIIVGVK